MEVLDVSHECLTLRAHDGIRTLPDRLQLLQGLFPIAVVFLSYFTSHLTSDSSLRRFPICQDVGSTFLEFFCFICVWIACGIAPVTSYDGTSSGPIDVVPVPVPTYLVLTIARWAQPSHEQITGYL